MSPWKVFMCSSMLQLSWYLSLTILLKMETLLTTFLFSNMNLVFFQRTSASVSSLKLLYRLMSIKHLMYVIDLRCMTSHIDASILSGLPFPICTSSHRYLQKSISLIFNFQTKKLEPISLNISPNELSIFLLFEGYEPLLLCQFVEYGIGQNRFSSTREKDKELKHRDDALTLGHKKLSWKTLNGKNHGRSQTPTILLYQEGI